MGTTTLPVVAQQDHIKKLTSSDPVRALAELVWNAVDADADVVEIEFVVGYAGTIEEIIVRDNGLGMSLDEAKKGFSRLGGSWKSGATRTKTRNRILHGREGEGRFKAFALGSPVEWESVCGVNGSKAMLRVVGDLAALREIVLYDPEKVDAEATGTSVWILNVREGMRDLRSDAARHQLIQLLAPYLASYPSVKVAWRLEQDRPASGLVDRDELRDEDAAMLEGQPQLQGRLRVLPRYTIENYLVHPDELWELLPPVAAEAADARAAAKADYANRLWSGLDRYAAHCAVFQVMVINRKRLQEYSIGDGLDPVLHETAKPLREAVREVLEHYDGMLDAAAMLREFDVLYASGGRRDGESEETWKRRRLMLHVHGKTIFERHVVPYLQGEMGMQSGGEKWPVFLSQGAKQVPDDLRDFFAMALNP